MKKIKVKRTRREEAERNANRFKNRKLPTEKLVIERLYISVLLEPYADELDSMSNGELAQTYGVPASYVSVIRAALDDALRPTGGDKRDIWAEWQKQNGGGG